MLTSRTLTTRIASIVGVVLLLPVLFIAAAAGAFGGSASRSQPTPDALSDIPADYLALYRAAATVCPGLDWSILAAIGKIESDHGRSQLPGVHSGENHAGAAGPMQFLQPTWDGVLARHQIPPGGATPPSRYNPHDAIHAAAWLLCDNGARDGRDLHGALWNYNHSETYIRDVLAQADKYRTTPPNGAPSQLRTDWPAEQATEPDPTSGGHITPRTFALVQALQSAGMTGESLSCYGHRPANPNSDHPQGRACDIMFNPHNQNSVAQGWRAATWLVTNQATLGVKYLIWQGQEWSVQDPRWVAYRSKEYGCPNPNNLTGCHYNHVHISVY